MTVFELAKKYYPRLWDEARIQTLAEAGRLTPEQAAEILQPVSNLDTVGATGEE